MRSRRDGLSPAAAQAVQASAEALDAGRVDQADRQLAGVSAADAGHPEILRMKAGVLGMRGQHRDAIAIMQQAVASRPDRSRAVRPALRGVSLRG